MVAPPAIGAAPLAASSMLLTTMDSLKWRRTVAIMSKIGESHVDLMDLGKPGRIDGAQKWGEGRCEIAHVHRASF